MEYPPAAGIGGDNPEDGFAMKALFDQVLASLQCDRTGDVPDVGSKPIARFGQLLCFVKGSRGRVEMLWCPAPAPGGASEQLQQPIAKFQFAVYSQQLPCSRVSAPHRWRHQAAIGQDERGQAGAE